MSFAKKIGWNDMLKKNGLRLLVCLIGKMLRERRCGCQEDPFCKDVEKVVVPLLRIRGATNFASLFV